MANTVLTFLPFGAEFPASNFPQLSLINRRPVLWYDASTAETAYWTGIARQGLGSTLTARIFCIMASATSGKVDFEGQIEAITDGDSFDLDAGDSFDTANTITAPTVPGTAGYLFVISMTLTNKDSIAAGDYFRFALKRDAADGTNDTATGDCGVLAVEIQDA